jgi:Ner family transcriptional regulator
MPLVGSANAPQQVQLQHILAYEHAVDFVRTVFIIMGMSTNRTWKAQKDWHPADVIAALRKRNTSLRQLAIKYQYSHIQRVLTSPWLAAEQIVAKALGVEPEQIWPTRYANPEERQRAFNLTRKIKVTMPCKPPVPETAASSAKLHGRAIPATAPGASRANDITSNKYRCTGHSHG